MLLSTSMQVANNLLVATESNNLVATRSIRVTFLLDPTCFDLLYGSSMVVASNLLDFVSSGTSKYREPLDVTMIVKNVFPLKALSSGFYFPYFI